MRPVAAAARFQKCAMRTCCLYFRARMGTHEVDWTVWLKRGTAAALAAPALPVASAVVQLRASM